MRWLIEEVRIAQERSSTTCPNCGKIFNTRRLYPRQTLCSPKCRDEYRKSRPIQTELF